MSKEDEIREKLWEVRDPEFGRSIMERNLVDDIRVQSDTAHIIFHLTVPFCPDVFALHIGREIRKKAQEVPEIKRVVLTVQQHIKADMLNRTLGSEES